MNLELFDLGGRWRQVKRCDPRALGIVDGTALGLPPHYSRRTPGSAEFLTVGKTMVLITDDERAVWGVIEHDDPRGNRVWRNTMFRNEGAGLSSALIAEATHLTLSYWARNYGFPAGDVWLRTEIDPTKVRHKRDPGRCYLKAGWRRVGEVNGLIHFRAPGLARAGVEARIAMEAA